VRRVAVPPTAAVSATTLQLYGMEREQVCSVVATGACGGGACGVELTDDGLSAVGPAGALCNAHAAGLCSADKLSGECAAAVLVSLQSTSSGRVALTLLSLRRM
jgi:hypothetical protein